MSKKEFQLPKIAIWWPDLASHWRAWLPSRGNVLFTLLLVSGLLWANSVGALPLRMPSAAGTSTGTIAYQGRLADSAGNPITTSGIGMQFCLYDTDVGGSPVDGWCENHPSVPVEDGLFSVLLGSINPIPVSLLTNHSSLWLGITIGSDSEMTPREQIASVPYAMIASTVPHGGVTSGKIGLDYAVATMGQFSTSSTEFVDVSGSTLSVNCSVNCILDINFAGSLFALMQANQRASTLLTVNVDGMDRTDLVNMDLSAWSGTTGVPNPAVAPAGFRVLAPVAAGTHTVKLRVLAASYDPSYRHGGIGYNNRASTLSVVAFSQ